MEEEGFFKHGLQVERLMRSLPGSFLQRGAPNQSDGEGVRHSVR